MLALIFKSWSSVSVRLLVVCNLDVFLLYSWESSSYNISPSSWTECFDHFHVRVAESSWNFAMVTFDYALHDTVSKLLARLLWPYWEKQGIENCIDVYKVQWLFQNLLEENVVPWRYVLASQQDSQLPWTLEYKLCHVTSDSCHHQNNWHVWF